MKKHTKLSLTLAVATLLAAHTASADFYISANAGISSVDESGFENATSFQVFGGYQFGRHVAAQVGYVDLGSFDAESNVLSDLGAEYDVTVNDASVEISGTEISVVGILPFSERFSGYAKAGAFIWDSEIDVTVSGGGASASANEKDDDVDSLIGLGLAFEINQRLSLNAEVTRYDALESDITFAGAGIKLRF